MTASAKPPRWSELPRLVASLRRGAVTRDKIAAAAPLLADHRASDRLDDLLDDAPGERDVSALYARGRRAVLRGSRDAAKTLLARAQSRANVRTVPALRARIAFELGCILLDEGGAEAAASVATWAEELTRTPSADVLHLRALIADRRGARDEAISLYRRAIAAASAALTPLTRVLALRNLAETLAHESPSEAVAMYRLALETLDANDLDPRLAPALHNGLGYAAICVGDLVTAQSELDAARGAAERLHAPLIRAYALYNQSIVYELRDELAQAEEMLAHAAQTAQGAKLAELNTWCRIRASWLALKLGDRAASAHELAAARRGSSPAHAEAIATLEAIASLATDAGAASTFGDLADAYLERGDAVTGFTTLLWQAIAYRRANAVKGARAAAQRACAVRKRGAIRVSPSWWSREVVEAARADGGASCADDLHPTVLAVLEAAQAPVELRGDQIFVAGRPLDANVWQRRSGARVLQRLFAMLRDACPRAIARDELADALWPDSEGDKAVRNLYGAIKDLRRVIAAAPGLTLVARDGGYALELGKDVTRR